MVYSLNQENINISSINRMTKICITNQITTLSFNNWFILLFFNFLYAKTAPPEGSGLDDLLLASELVVAVAAAECCHFAGCSGYAAVCTSRSSGSFGRQFLFRGLNIRFFVDRCHHVYLHHYKWFYYFITFLLKFQWF